MKEQVGTARTKYNTAIAYDTADRVTGMTFTNGSVSYTYDGVGRIATKSITAGTYTDTYTYSYLAGGYGTGSTTGLITSQSQGNESCTSLPLALPERSGKQELFPASSSTVPTQGAVAEASKSAAAPFQYSTVPVRP